MYAWKLTGLMSNSVSDTMRQITGVRVLLKCRHTVFHPSDVSCKPPRLVGAISDDNDVGTGHLNAICFSPKMSAPGEQLEPKELRVPEDLSTFE